MTHEEITALARDAGFNWPEIPIDERLERFANLVIAAERERCALVCERKIDAPAGTYQILMAAAAAIRKGEKESLTVEARKPVPEFELIEKWEGE